MAHAWMTEARRIRAETDGGHLRGGAPRAVWMTLGTAPRKVSAQSAAARLAGEGRPCHLVWDPVTGEIVQLVSVLRAACALGAPEQLERTGHSWPSPVNNEGRICVQIGVLARPADPFTDGPLARVAAITDWLDTWGVPRRWPAGRPAAYREDRGERSRAVWAQGGHFGASQVPGCENAGPGDIDTDRLTGPHVMPVRSRELTTPTAAAAFPISA